MKGRRGGAELEEEDEEILVCFVMQSLCLFPQQICPPLPFALMCPAFAARYLEANIVFSPQHLFVVQSLFAVFTLTFSF